MSLKYAEHLSDVPFLDGWYISSQVCDSILHWKNEAEAAGNVKAGTVGDDIIVKEHKDSLDTILETSQYHYDSYMLQLRQVMDLYKEKYVWVDRFSPWGPIEKTAVQKYNPGGGFHGWHSERTQGTGVFGRRMLVFMTYLNTVEEGGETEWYYQKLKVKPEKGLTVVWPADWTYTHRGIAAPNETKVIVTGWVHYVDNFTEEQFGHVMK